MIQISPQSKVYLCIPPIDFRKGIDGLIGVCKKLLLQDPFSGTVFVFRNRKKTCLRFLFYDGQGFWLCTKRFSEGKIHWWPTSKANYSVLDARSLQVLLWNGNPTASSFARDWRSIAS